MGWTISGPRLLESVDRSNTNHLPNAAGNAKKASSTTTQTDDLVLGRKRGSVRCKQRRMVPAVWPALDAKSGWIGAASFVKFAAGQRPGRDGTLGALDSDREGRLACLFLAKLNVSFKTRWHQVFMSLEKRGKVKDGEGLSG